MTPTGISSLLYEEAQTIPSVLGLRKNSSINQHQKLRPFNPNMNKIFKASLIIMDEISMLGTDILSYLDRGLRSFYN